MAPSVQRPTGADGVHPLRRETDLIFSLGRWVLREAVPTMSTWRRELAGAQDAYITVNLSAHQLSDPDLLETISAALTDWGSPKRW